MASPASGLQFNPSASNLVYADLEVNANSPKELSATYSVSKVPLQRLICARSLTLDSDDDAIATSIRLSKDAEWTVREAIAVSIGKFGIESIDKHSDKLVHVLLTLCRDPNAEVRLAAASTLSSFPQQSPLASWLSLVRDKDQRVRCAGAECLGGVAKHASEAVIQSYVVPELVAMSKYDVTFGARKTACRALAKLCHESTQATPVKVGWSQMAAECALQLASDPAWPCRRAAADAFPLVCGKGNKYNSAMATLLIALSERDVSRWVRAAAKRSLGAFIVNAQIESDSSELVRCFATLASSHDEDARYACAFYMPGVLISYPAQSGQRWESALKEAFYTLSQDTSFKIRRSLAHSIGHIASSLGPSVAVRDLIKPFTSFMQDMDDEEEIRLGAIRSATLMVASVPQSDRPAVMEIIENTRLEVATAPLAALAVSRDARLSLATQLVDLAKVSAPLNGLAKLYIGLVHDEAYKIRETALDALGEIAPSLDSLDSVVEDMQQMAISTHHLSRWAFARASRSILKSGEGITRFESLNLRQTLEIFAKDPVQSVRDEAERALKLLA